MLWCTTVPFSWTRTYSFTPKSLHVRGIASDKTPGYAVPEVRRGHHNPTARLQKEQVLIEFAVAQQMKLKEMLDSLVARLEREEGQDMIEYALLAALISIVAIAVILLVGPYLRNLFQDVVNALDSA